MSTRAVILLAGLGSRLGRPHPKPLTPLSDGQSILARQLGIVRSFDLPVIGVVGFKMELVMEAAPDILFAYNPNYDATNTAKSLLCALRQTRGENILWMNGDVVFEPAIIERLLEVGEPAVAVNNARTAEEEVKYTLNDDGYINAISKQVGNARGEALGINYVPAELVEAFCDKLDSVGDNDYFEKAMEELIEERGNVFRAVDVSDLLCMEVDFDSDLQAVNKLLD
ncbi:MAG: phosphocholine cytidylyltransferase family protein [Gammaproteobacteria bacterium]|nr:phosphocholine cytidylyltransferase family protein [Gammaproteobacteria bacterium]